MKATEEIVLEHDHLPEHKMLKMAGSELHYWVAGPRDAPAILFLHPAFSDHQSFDIQVDYFAKRYRVITLDLLGHGCSRAHASKQKIDASADHMAAILAEDASPKCISWAYP